MDHEKWISAGERLGLKDRELQDYVDRKEKDVLDREERARKREDERMRLETERLRLDAERRRSEREEADKARALEYETRKLEIEKLEMEAKMRREEQEMELELIRLRAETGVGRVAETGAKSLRPKLPKFEEQKDDMDAYMERFERFATTQGWKEDTWAVSLSSLLTGKGLEVYTSMPPEETNDYKVLKKAVFKRYQLIEEGFRQGCRESRPEHGETVFQFMARIVRYRLRLMERTNVYRT